MSTEKETNMKLKGRLVLIFLTLLFSITILQSSFAMPDERSGASSTADSAAVSGTEASRKTSDDEVSGLQVKIDALTKLLEQQQKAMAEMQQRLEALEARGRLSETAASSERLEPPAISNTAAASSGSAAKSPKPAAQEKRGLTAGWDDSHAFIRNADGSFETNIAGYSQLDFHGYQSGVHPPNTFLIRRARLALEGRVHRFFEYRIEGEFAGTTSTLLRDFYVNIHRIDEFQSRFGQTREPFSQEEMRSDNHQEFVERSLVNNLVPSRSPGVMVSGVVGSGILEYQTGAFNGKGLLANNNNGTPDTALRLRLNPWKQSDSFWLKGIILGGAYNQGRNLNGLSVRGLTESRITFFQPETVNGKLYRANGEVSWLLGPATLRAEYDQTNQFRHNLGPGGANLPGVVAKGYMAQFTYLLTGETKPDIGSVTPKHNFLEANGSRTGLGAWELKIRYSNLQISDGTSRSNRADTIYFGANWYMNKFVRYMLDLGFECFKDQARAPKPGDPNFFTILSRVQLQF